MHPIIVAFVLLVLTFSGANVEAQAPISAAMVNGAASNWKDDIPSQEELAFAARLSSIVYQVNSIDSPSWGYSQVVLTPLAWWTLPRTGTEVAVVVVHATQTIHVVFRGTDGAIEDTATDASFVTVPYSDGSPGRTFVDGNVHKGFKDSVFSSGTFLRQLDESVSTAKERYPTYRIELDGHSLGGAQATLYGVHLAKSIPGMNFRVMSIGCPRLGDGDFKTAVNVIPNLAIWRVVNGDDIMPRVPLNVMLDYQHVGHMIHLKKDGTISAYYQQHGLEGVYEGVDTTDWVIDLISNPLLPIMSHIPWDYELRLTTVDGEKWPKGFELSDNDKNDTCCLWILTCLRRCSD